MAAISTLDHEQIYKILSNEILRFVHKPGDAISEHYLCERFSLSRTPMRSVLQRLQENGLVRIIPRKGSIVTRLNYDIIDQFIYERVAVETMVLRDFIRICTPADVEKVRYANQQLAALGKINRTDPQAFDVNRFLELDHAMHEIWFRATHKTFLWNRLTSEQSSYTRFCTLDILYGNNTEDVMAEHTQMVELIDTRNTEALEELIRRHLYGGMRRLSGLVFTTFNDYFEPTDSLTKP